MSACHKCQTKDNKITDLKGQLAFHKQESRIWKGMFTEQRGGQAYKDMQERLVEVEAENRSMLRAIASLEKEMMEFGCSNSKCPSHRITDSDGFVLVKEFDIPNYRSKPTVSSNKD